MSTTLTRRPWDDLADELEPSQGPYCDYAAWEEWIESRMADEGPLRSCWDMEAAIDAMDIGTKIKLYSIMCELACGVQAGEA